MAKYRILEEENKYGESYFYPQENWCGFWFYFTEDCDEIKFESLTEAKVFLKREAKGLRRKIHKFEL